MEKVVIEHFKRRLQEGEYVEREMKLLPKNLKGKLLEVGCGTGFTYYSEKVEMYGIDITPEMVKLLKKSYPKAHAILGNVKMLPFKKEIFDVLTSNMLLHHLVGSNPQECKRNIKAAMREMKYVLKSHGILLIREVLARNYLFSLIMFYVTSLCSKFGIEINSLDIRSKVITFFLTEKDFKTVSLENGFKIKEIESKDWKLAGGSKLGEYARALGEEKVFLLIN